ncbi:type II secretion system protein N [Curvibacter sp. CHRR-16]|uniref:type II secretion system protein N n=1 Tax=Curvibacter sp. CHRR-16 TaxID=2835872 RepID=UPI001BDACA9C|nr:type II secretion system protein N [Curvibacter sp. CHRR-16]MBT0569149.1 type II secretion system protein N [Curvibacter sp. CHRR-16]
MRRPSPLLQSSGDTPPHAPWAWMVGGLLCGALCTTLWMAPARWLASGVAQITADRLQLQAPQGSIWHGSAQWVLGAGKDSGISETLSLPGRMGWAWQLGWAAGPTVGVTLHPDCCRRAPITLQVGWNNGKPRLTVHEIAETDSLRIPAKLLTALGAPWNSLQLNGTIAFSGSTLQLPLQPSKVLWDGRWQLDILNLESSISTLRPLGSYRISSDGSTSNQVQINTLNGALLIEGQGQFVSNRLRFRGYAEAAPGNEDALNNLLNIIGRRQGPRTLLQIG